MYDELAQAQKPGRLERFVVNAVIPSVLLTFALREPGVAAPRVRPPVLPLSTPPFVLITSATSPCDYGLGRLQLPDVFPVLVSMPHLMVPPQLTDSEAQGRVLLKALVNVHGRVDRRSMQVLRVSDGRLVVPARRALVAARFRPAWRDGERIPAWITIAVNP